MALLKRESQKINVEKGLDVKREREEVRRKEIEEMAMLRK